MSAKFNQLLSYLRFYLSFLLILTITFLLNFSYTPRAIATVDEYVSRYLQVREPVTIPYNIQGETKEFSGEDISQGKVLFEKNCLNCHVGGQTVPNPYVSLSLDDLKGATPDRSNITNLVAYMRHPVTYDGSEDTFWCREVPASWMSASQIENLAAFVIRAAEKSPGWGSTDPRF